MMHQTPKYDRKFSILILAGGRGKRMGGRDKGLLPLAGKPVIEHVLARMRPHSPHILISANRNIDAYASYGYPVIVDTLDQFPGPLAGILSGLAACRTDWLLVLPVDAPLVSVDYPGRMLDCVQRAPAQACVAECAGKMEPVFCLLHRDLLGSLQSWLSGGKRSVRDWMTAIGAQAVDFSDVPDQFTNMNDDADLRALETRLQAQGENERAV